MVDEIVVPGIGVGGMNDKYEIKILICYLLDSVKEPLSRLQLTEVFQDGQYVNYFAFCEALEELCEAGNLSAEQKEFDTLYHLEPLGKETAQRLHRSLPSSLRDRVVAAAMQVITRLKKEQENKAEIIPYQNGFLFRAVIGDVDFDLLRLELFAPDELQAENMRSRFLKDPLGFYREIMQSLCPDFC